MGMGWWDTLRQPTLGLFDYPNILRVMQCKRIFKQGFPGWIKLNGRVTRVDVVFINDFNLHIAKANIISNTTAYMD